MEVVSSTIGKTELHLHLDGSLFRPQNCRKKKSQKAPQSDIVYFQILTFDQMEVPIVAFLAFSKHPKGCRDIGTFGSSDTKQQ